MRTGQSWVVLGGIALAVLACSGGGRETRAPAKSPPHAIGGGPRATKDASRALLLNGNWMMTQKGPGLIGHANSPLMLRIEGTHVLGWYHPDQGMVDGEMHGDVIEGSWKENDGEGNFVWNVSSDGRHFEGEFSGMLHSQSIPEGSTWSGSRK